MSSVTKYRVWYKTRFTRGHVTVNAISELDAEHVFFGVWQKQERPNRQVKIEEVEPIYPVEI